VQDPPPPQKPPPRKRDTPWLLIVIAVLAVYALLIVILNREEVDISFVFFSTEISKLVLILLCLGLGFVLGYLFDGWRRRRGHE
jgi:uncharacterized integral membrane protein